MRHIQFITERWTFQLCNRHRHSHVEQIVDIPVVVLLLFPKMQSGARQLMNADVLLLDSRRTTFLVLEGTTVMAAFDEDETLMAR